MYENKNSTDDIVRNVEDENLEVIAEIQRDSTQDVDTKVENSLEDIALPDLSEAKKIELSTPVTNKESKQHKTKHLVKQARYIVKEADNQSKECKLLLADNLAEYEDAKINLKEHGYDTCSALLDKMGYRSAFNAPVEKEALVMEAEEEVLPMVIKEVSTGKFTGFVSALIAGVITAVGLIYLNIEKQGMTLDIFKMPSPELTDKIISWFSTLLGIAPNMYVGVGVFGLSIVTVMVIVYAVTVSLQVNANLRYAEKQFVESELYAEKKTECKDAFEKVGGHMKDSIKTLKTYEVLFNEQQGKLQRITHIEGEKEKAYEYHKKSFAEINATQKLIVAMKNFMAVSMSKKGKLSKESVERLITLKKEMDTMIEGLY